MTSKTRHICNRTVYLAMSVETPIFMGNSSRLSHCNICSSLWLENGIAVSIKKVKVIRLWMGWDFVINSLPFSWRRVDSIVPQLHLISSLSTKTTIKFFVPYWLYESHPPDRDSGVLLITQADILSLFGSSSSAELSSNILLPALRSCCVTFGGLENMLHLCLACCWGFSDCLIGVGRIKLSSRHQQKVFVWLSVSRHWVLFQTAIQLETM